MALGPRQVAPELLNKVTKALGITALDQWYYVSQKAAHRIIGGRALKLFGGTVASFLKHAYPLHSFDEEKLAPKINLEREQKFIEVIIRKLFPNAEIHTKARKAVGIKNPDTEAYLEIDFWIPSLKLGIEYQDRHHYEYQWYAHGALEEYKKRDEIKKDTMATMGYTLITIGYWWDKTIESVAATIRKFRPDLLQEHANTIARPIPADPPPGYVTASPIIPGVSGIMSPFIPTSTFDPSNWFAGEKHDGIRGVYNANMNKMFSRSGNELSVLPSLLNNIPNMLVEGEIVAGRGNYNKTVVVSSHTHQGKVNWPLFRYIIFDVPDSEVGTYTRRYSAIVSQLLHRPYVFAQSAFRVLLSSKSHLKTLVHAIIFDGGEGVIVQKDAQYEYGRAKGLAKIKVRRDDDAQVLHVNDISCTCELTSGAKVEITFCDDFDPSSLKAGDVVSYYHNGYSQSGTPKNAEIYKIRYDVTWKQLVASAKDQNVSKRRFVKEAIGANSLMDFAKRNKMGHWNKSPNVRAFFDEFARSSGFDPLVAKNWYPVRQSALRNAGGSGLLNAHSYNLKNALACAYPELSFEEKFVTWKTKEYWNEPRNVRAFFDEFARTSGFDPLVTENWYPLRITTLQHTGGESLLYAFNYRFIKALMTAYPELKFEERNFVVWKTKAQYSVEHWNKLSNVRAFFDKFALTHGLDPLVPENWYSVRNRTYLKAGGSGLLKAYKSVKNALVRAYPEVKFDETQFRTIFIEKPKMGHGHWNKPANVRQFLNQFAQTAGFDPLQANNWNAVSGSAVRKAGGGGVLFAYDYSLKKALLSAYPELKF